jgi:hypothetical protein
MASVILLQSLYGLSDSDTVDAVTFDLRWKGACGLPVTAAAFHATTLTYWRRRLAASKAPNRIVARSGRSSTRPGAEGEDRSGVRAGRRVQVESEWHDQRPAACIDQQSPCPGTRGPETTVSLLLLVR